MLSLKTRLRISIVALVTIVVVALSALYLYDFTAIAFEGAESRVNLVSEQARAYILERIDRDVAYRGLHPHSLNEVKREWTEMVRTDPLIPAMLEQTVAHADILESIRISGEDGKTLTASSAYLIGKPLPATKDLDEVKHRNAFAALFSLLQSRTAYAKTVPLGVPEQHEPIFRIAVVLQSRLLLDAFEEPFQKIAMVFLPCLAVSMLLAFYLPGVVMKPLERVSRRIDLIRSEKFEDGLPPANHSEPREFAAVQSKLDLLGQQFKGARQDAFQLRANVQEMLQKLEEAVLLFDAFGRVVMAGRQAERLLAKSHEEIAGKMLPDLLPSSTVLGGLVENAIRFREPIHDRVVMLDQGARGKVRLLVNVELLQTGADQAGTLVTLRDAESRRQLEQQLDISARLGAISRLTGGVAHEIKNPLNAMALHLEVLKSKLEPDDPEIDVISKEIQRLDHVVKTFLNFNKPVEVQTKPLDLSALASEVVRLIRPEAALNKISIDAHLDSPQWMAGDSDLLMQALLNIVMNSVEAMEAGGILRVETTDSGDGCRIEISDNGPGILPEIQDKIFNLYFSTKRKGSGIGLAMTFRVIQLHGGTISVRSEPGSGASFELRFPLLSAMDLEGEAAKAHS